MLCPCSSYQKKTTNTPTLNGGDSGGVRILLFSEVTLFKYNVSTILSPIVASSRITPLAVIMTFTFVSVEVAGTYISNGKCFILGTTAPKLIKFLFFTSFLEPVNGGGLFVPLPIGQASWESNLPKAKNYLSLTIGRDFFRSLAFTFSSLTPTEQTYGQIEK